MRIKAIQLRESGKGRYITQGANAEGVGVWETLADALEELFNDGWKMTHQFLGGEIILVKPEGLEDDDPRLGAIILPGPYGIRDN